MSKKNGTSKKDHRLSSIESAMKRKPYNRRLLTGQSRIIIDPPSTLSDVLAAGYLNNNCALSPPTGSPVMTAGCDGVKNSGNALSSSSSSLDTQQARDTATAIPGRIGIRPVPTTHQIQQLRQLIEHNKSVHRGELLPEVSFQPRGSTADKGNHFPKFHFNSLPTPSPPSSVVVQQPTAQMEHGDDGFPGFQQQQQKIPVEESSFTTSSSAEGSCRVDLSFNVFAALLVAFEKVPAPEHHPFDGYF